MRIPVIRASFSRALAIVTIASSAIGCSASEAALATAPDLRLSEIGATRSGATPAWVEIENTSSAPIDLAGYSLNVRGLDRNTLGWSSAANTAVSFPLSSLAIPGGGFVVVAGKAYDDLYDGPSTHYVLSGATVPSWTASGSIELLRADGETIDYVAFGAGGAPPRTADAWSGPPAPLIPNGATGDMGQTLARTPGAPDTGTATDWEIRAWATPGGPNDVIDAADEDGDGVPDSAEVPGGTYGGLPIHDWGARIGQKDVFLEIDWMDPSGYDGTFDAALFPRAEAIEKLVSVFAARGIALHVDTGSLGGGGVIPFSCRTDMGVTTQPPEGVESFARLKALQFDLRRGPLFHYVVFGHSQDDVACGHAGSSGTANIPGKDALITLGRWGFTDTTEKDTDFLINTQASTLMHELGHNFGLHHGGDEDRNYKPGYLSVMNYLYDLAGLPTIGPSEGDRYYYAYGIACGSHGIDDVDALSHSPTSDPAGFHLDYSDGSSAPLTDWALDELHGLGRAGSSPVDFNWDFTFAAAASADIDAAGSSATLCVRDGVANQVLTDHDDWSSLLFDVRAAASVDSAGPAREHEASPRLLARLRRSR